MQSQEIRKRFLNFFEKRGHAILPSASLITPDERGVTNSTLFNTAGMQPLIPYLIGEPHPKGTRLVDVQKCIRTVDIDEVGDNTHATFFEMLGNWSLGDYFKAEAIQWSYEFLTSKDEGLGLDPKRLYITVFEGDENAPRDEEAFEIWKKFMPENRIYFLGAKSNWWSAGDSGPCGPDTEMFYDLTPEGLGDLTHEEYLVADDAQKVVEIWNDVFMQFEKKDGKVVGKLPKNNVDTGAGLERITMILQGKDNIFETDLFQPLIEIVEKHTKLRDVKSERIIADHLKAALFLIAEGVQPDTTGRGYIVRRLLRRVIRNEHKLRITDHYAEEFIDTLLSMYGDVYENLRENRQRMIDCLDRERENFQKPLDWLAEYKQDLINAKEGVFTKRIKDVPILTDKETASANYVYHNYQTYGVPFNMSQDVIAEVGLKFDKDEFDRLFKEHQKLSRAGAEQKFKGGLASHGEKETKYHTATHLLHAALRKVLGTHVEQKGSNVTAERLRFDFSHPAKMTDEEKKRVEDMINEQIKADLPVTQKDMPYDEAIKLGAMSLFGDKYGDVVSVYTIGDEGAGEENVFSREFCGGPHVTHTGALGIFRIVKEEATSAGVRRIKAILE